MEKLFFDECVVEVNLDNGFTKTIFDDDTFVPALPQDNEVYKYTAKELGYDDNLKILCVEHEICHTFLSEACGLKFSPTLWTLAHQGQGQGCIPLEMQYIEEAVVLSFQKFLKGGPIDPILNDYVKVNDLELKPLKKEARNLLQFISD